MVIYDLAIKAGVKFDAHYMVVGIDPPELMNFIKSEYPLVVWDKPKVGIWKAFKTNGLPSRKFRWCCKLLKEPGGGGRRVVTGMRWQESTSRRRRRLFEICNQDKTKYYVNPIIDWSEKDIWEYIVVKGLPYCSLYDEGFKRLGCVLCPMSTYKNAIRDIERFPKTALAWRNAVDRYYNDSVSKGKSAGNKFNSSNEMWQWWLSRKGEPKVNEAQCIMFDN